MVTMLRIVRGLMNSLHRKMKHVNNSYTAFITKLVVASWKNALLRMTLVGSQVLRLLLMVSGEVPQVYQQERLYFGKPLVE